MLIATVLLGLLFVVAFFNLPTKKFFACLQTFFGKSPPQITADPIPTPNKVMKRSTTQNKTELGTVFATFDRNNDGYITRQELKESLKNIGILMEENEISDMFQNVDSNGDGLIDLDEFCELYESFMVGQGVSGEEDGKEAEEGRGEADLKEAFDVFDGDRDGLISVEELGLVLSCLGFKEGKKLEDCKEMIRKVDMDGDGMVNFDEFKRMMKGGTRLIPVS